MLVIRSPHSLSWRTQSCPRHHLHLYSRWGTIWGRTHLLVGAPATLAHPLLPGSEHVADSQPADNCKISLLHSRRVPPTIYANLGKRCLSRQAVPKRLVAWRSQGQTQDGDRGSPGFSGACGGTGRSEMVLNRVVAPSLAGFGQLYSCTVLALRRPAAEQQNLTMENLPEYGTVQQFHSIHHSSPMFPSAHPLLSYLLSMMSLLSQNLTRALLDLTI